MNVFPKPPDARIWIYVAVLLGLCSFAIPAEKEEPPKPDKKAAETRSLASVLPSEKWQRVEKAVDRALSWLSSQQEASGDFPTYESGQPAITSLSTMAFLSRGHQPGIGTYGKGINRAI